MSKSFAYIRTSDRAPAGQQRRQIERYAKRRDLKIVRWFNETRRSAYGPRPVFQRMMEGVMIGQASAVISDKRERFSRNLVESVGVANLANHGVEFHFVADQSDQERVQRKWRRSAETQDRLSVLFVRMVNGLRQHR